MRAAYLVQGIGFLLLAGMVLYLGHTGRLVLPQTERNTGDPIPTKDPERTMSSLILRSPAWNDGERIPAKYTCDGENLSPPLAIDGVPEATRSFVLIVEDPDVPRSIREDGLWVHWIRFNIPADATRLAEGEEPPGNGGMTTNKRTNYGGPCPPDGEHRYYFTVYALDTLLDVPHGSEKDELLAAIEGHVLDTAQLVGRYVRSETDMN